MIAWLEEDPEEVVFIQVKDDADGGKVQTAISNMFSQNSDICDANFREKIQQLPIPYVQLNCLSCSRSQDTGDYAWGGTGIDSAMNPARNDILKESKYTKTGIIIMDFFNKHGIDDPYNFVEQIVSRNFKY